MSVKLEQIYDIALKHCPFYNLKLVLEEFPFDVPKPDPVYTTQPKKSQHDDNSQEEEEKDHVITYDTENVEGKAVTLLTEDLQSLDFAYWGEVRKFHGDPHGVGVAFCSLNLTHCFIGSWYKGQLCGLGQRWIDSSTVEKTVMYGTFVGNFHGISQSNERKGPQWDLHYRKVGSKKFSVTRFIDRCPTMRGDKESTEQEFIYRDGQPLSTKTKFKGNTAKSTSFASKVEHRFEVSSHVNLI